MFDENEFIPSLLEQSVEKNLDRMFGDKDPQLRFLKKLDLMNDNSKMYQERLSYVLQQIRLQNEYEYQSLFNEPRLILNEKIEDAEETKEQCNNMVTYDIENKEE